MIDDITKLNLDSSVRDIRRVKSVLDAIYYNSNYASLTFKPVLASLIDACNYLESNISKMASGEIKRG